MRTCARTSASATGNRRATEATRATPRAECRRPRRRPCVADRGHRAARAIAKRARGRPASVASEVARRAARLADRELRGGGAASIAVARCAPARNRRWPRGRERRRRDRSRIDHDAAALAWAAACARRARSAACRSCRSRWRRRRIRRSASITPRSPTHFARVPMRTATPRAESDACAARPSRSDSSSSRRG